MHVIMESTVKVEDIWSNQKSATFADCLNLHKANDSICIYVVQNTVVSVYFMP